MKQSTPNITDAIETLRANNHIYYDPDLGTYRLNLEKTIELLKQRHVYPRTYHLYDRYHSYSDDTGETQPVICACAVGSLNLSFPDPLPIVELQHLINTLFAKLYFIGITRGFDNTFHIGNKFTPLSLTIYTLDDPDKKAILYAGLRDGQHIRAAVNKTGRFIDHKKHNAEEFFRVRKKKTLLFPNNSPIPDRE